MSAIAGGDNRDVIPRWRPLATAARLGELASAGTLIPAARRSGIVESAEAFRNEPGIYTAGDLISHALHAGSRDHDVIAAAQLVENSLGAPGPARRLASIILSDSFQNHDIEDPTFEVSAATRKVATARSVVRRQPRNALRWCDLALAHINLGDIDKAERCVSVAHQLAPNNRHVVRSAARFYILRGDAERALRLVDKSPATRTDPWLQATELSLAELTGRGSRRAKDARATVDRGMHSPFHLSELFSELATAEMRAGRMRHARRYMEMALRDPTENALAQAEWAAGHGLNTQIGDTGATRWSFEARALQAVSSGDYDDAALSGLAWQADQPFAADPAKFTSYVASVGLQDWQVGIASAERGLVANPGDAMLRNNLIFALANAGNLRECVDELAKLPHFIADGHERATITATRGLVAFRLGDVEQGRALYRSSSEQMRWIGQRERQKLALVLLAREELLADSSQASEALELAEKSGADAASDEVRLWLERIRALVNGSSTVVVARKSISP